jgi:hypothetical protein
MSHKLRFSEKANIRGRSVAASQSERKPDLGPSHAPAADTRHSVSDRYALYAPAEGEILKFGLKPLSAHTGGPKIPACCYVYRDAKIKIQRIVKNEGAECQKDRNAGVRKPQDNFELIYVSDLCALCTPCGKLKSSSPDDCPM